MTTLRFWPHDTWFFRDERPYDAFAGAILASRFPPGPRTMAGAIRTLIGDHWEADWWAYARRPDDYRAPGSPVPLRSVIGFGDDVGPLRLRGPWVVKGGQRLYPAPQILVRTTGKDGQEHWDRLRVGPPVDTDRGRIHLARWPVATAKAELGGRWWVTAQGLQRVLAGGVPQKERGEVFSEAELWERESRIGIALDHHARSAKPHYFFQTVPLRLVPGVALEVDVEGAPEPWPLPGWVRLGGDGRAAYVEVVTGERWPAAPATDAQGVMVVLLSALAGFSEDGMPPGFARESGRGGVATWVGTVAGVRLRIWCAVLGEAGWEGGWNMAAGTHGLPRVRRPLLAPGSVWFATVEDGTPLDQAMARLDGAAIGEEQELGRGLLAAGVWPKEADIG